MNMKNMKKFCIVTLLSLSATAHAQFQGMSTDDMSRMMGNAGEIMACLGRLDQRRLEALGERVEAAGAELEGLCNAGERDRAQRQARVYAEEFMAEPEYAQLLECGEIAQRMFPDLVDLGALDLDDDSNHVCDSL